ncbi:hypothetical protein CRM22_010790 [Opisthorchis felineus]|uniref:Centriolin n=1 Tax=Opisthorchis felineus TaxID=147828 RepID=A0A4S2KQZ0_OPIFE|nr:hypothetical protein CRM22_010790 [Opisthorchis felineus]
MDSRCSLQESCSAIYMTENLIKKYAGENPYFCTKLSISGKGRQYKIRVIENLKLVQNLYKLNLSHNCISKISNLECLSHLTHLDLAHNLISSMDGLQTLTGLLTLNLRGNQISSIPFWIKQCLVSLKTLNLADNRINSLHQLLRLRGLDSLTSLSFHGNPAVEDLVMTASSDNNSESELSRQLDAQIQQDSRSLIYRLFTLFHLRTLARLDGEPVKPEEIRKAIERFSQVETDHMLRKLQQRETDLDKLERANLELVRGLDTQYRMARAAQADQEMHLSKINRLEQELQAKDAMLASQTDELARACLKHYELEQELAFHKIDNKFAQFLLGPRPQVNQSDLQKVEATGDHPYVGRCRTRWAPQGQTSVTEEKAAEEERHTGGPLQSLFKPASLDSHLMRAGSGCAQRVVIRPNNLLPSPKFFSSLDMPRPDVELAVNRFQVAGRPNSLPLRPMATDSGIAVSIASPAPVERPQISSPTGNLSSSLEEVERLTKSIVERATLAPLSPQTERTRQLTEKALSELKSHIINSIRGPTNSTETTSTATSPDFKLLSRIARLESELSVARGHRPVGLPQNGNVSPTKSHLSNTKLGQTHAVTSPPSGFKTVPAPDSLLLPTRPSVLKVHQRDSTEEPSPSIPFTTPLGDGSDPVRSYGTHPADVPVALPVVDRNVDPSRELISQSTFVSQNSPSMHYSASSSTPSSRTTGTGRSIETAQYKSDVCVAGALTQRVQSATDKGDAWIGSRQPASDRGAQTASCMKQRNSESRQPGVGDTLPANSASQTSLASTENNEAEDDHMEPRSTMHRRQRNPHAEDSTRYPDYDDGYSDRRDAMTRMHRSNAYSRSKHRPPEVTSADEEKLTEVRRSANQARDSLTRTSASGTSGYGGGISKHRRKLLRSLSTTKAPKQRPPQCWRNRTVDSTDGCTMGAQAGQLLDMIIMFRKVCASELTKMRADLARMQNCFPRIAGSSLEHSASSIWYAEQPPEQVDDPVRSRSYNRTGAPNDVVSSRGTVRSIGDTLTNVTRPSPNGDDEDNSFDAPPSPKHSRPHRLRSHGQTQRQQSGSRHRRLLPSTSEPDEPLDWTSTQRNYRNNTGSRDGTPYFDHWPSDPAEYDRNEYISRTKAHSRHLSSTRESRNNPAPSGHPYEPVRRSLPCHITDWNAMRPRLPSARGRSLEGHRHSHSPEPRTLSRHRSPHSRRMNNVYDHDPPSVETAALQNLTNELLELRHGLKRTREANSGKLELALRQISLLELELQRQRCMQHDAHNIRERQAERSRWEKRLTATLSELKQCQANIGQLRGQMDQMLEVNAQSSRSQAQLDRQQEELEQAQAALDKQREEIARVNILLSNLLGINPADVSQGDLQQIQAGLVELNRQVQLDAGPGCHPNAVRRTQSMHTGLNGPKERPSNVAPNMFPASGAGLTRAVSGQFYCTVPEHHYLEDCLEQLQSQMAELELTQGEQQKKLRHATKAKRKLEKQVEYHSAEVDRLNAEAAARQEELTKTSEDLKRLLDEKDDTQRQQQRQLMTMASELSTVENTIAGRRSDLAKLEDLVRTTETELRTQQAQLKDTAAKFAEAKSEQERASTQLANVNAELSKTKEQLSQYQADLVRSKAEVEQTDAERRKLQSKVEQLERNIQTKENELHRLSSCVNEAQTKLSRLDGDIVSGEQRLQNQQRLLAEQKINVEEQQAELRQLSRQVTEEQSKLSALNRQADERRMELERLKTENSRESENGAANARELTTQIAAKQRELSEVQITVNTLSNEKMTLTQALESLKSERDRILSELEAKQQSSTELETALNKRRRELETVTDRVRSEEDRVKELTSQQHDLTNQLEQLRAQVRTETEALRGQDLARMKKTTELENTRSDADRELADLERLSSRQKSVGTDLRQLIQQRDLVKKQLERLQQKVRELERRKVELLDSISEAKLELHRVRTDSEAESNSLERIRHRFKADRDEFEQLSQRLDEKRSEVDRLQTRLSVSETAMDTFEQGMTEQRRQRIELTGELTKLGEAVYTGRLAIQSTNEERESSEYALQETLGQLDRAKEELRNVRDRKRTEQAEVENRLVSSRKQLQKATDELAKKRAQLAELEDKYKETETRLSNLGRTEAKCIELEQALAQQRNDKQSNNAGSQEKPADPEVLARSLAETKSALIAAQRDCKRAKRRSAKELAELERIAEEQCGRAGDLTEQLALVKRQYAQLKGQISTYGMLMDEIITIASQTELDEHGKRLEAALAAVRAELDQHPLHCLFNEAASSGLAGQTHRTVSLRQDLQQPSASTQLPRSFISSDSQPQPTSAGLYKPRRNHRATAIPEMDESTPGTANNTYRTANTTTTSGLGSSCLHASGTLLDTNGTVPVASDVSSPDDRAPLNRAALTESDWKRKISDRVAQQRQQAAAEWAESDSQFRALRCQVDDVRDRLEHRGMRRSHTAKQPRK